MATEGQAHIHNEISMDTLSVHRHHSHHSPASTAPIYRLPPELLASLFLRCALDDHGRRAHLARVVPSWVNVSYVCRYWREVALGCPSLWAYHFVISLRWTEELLVRSKQAPLKICLKFQYGRPIPWSLGSVKKLMGHAERFGELSLYLPDSNTNHIISMLCSPAPRLKKLHISAPDFHPEHAFVPFRGDTPALRTLVLSNCALPWYSFKLSALKTLHVFHIPAPFQQDVAEFLTALSCMQGLTELSLDGALSSAASFLRTTQFHTFQKIDLSCLATLFLRAPLSTIFAFLSCTNSPSNLRGRLDCFPESDPSNNFALLSSVVAQRFGLAKDQPPSSRTIRSLAIQFTANRSVSFLFSSRERDYDAVNSPLRQGNFWDCNVPLVLTVSWGELMTTVEDHIPSDVYSAILLTNIQTLHVIRPPFSPVFWRKTLEHLRGLRYIKLSQGNMPDLASVLFVTNRIPGDVENQASDHDQDHTLAQDLEELELSWIKFSDPLAISRKSLFDALASRGMPGGRLAMNFCTMGGYGRVNLVRSWDGLVNIPIVAESSSRSLSYHAFGLGDDDSDDDLEVDSDGDSVEELDVDWDDYLEVESGDDSGGASGSDWGEHSEGDSLGALPSASESASEPESHSEGHSEVVSESAAESASEGAPEGPDSESASQSSLESGSEGDSAADLEDDLEGDGEDRADDHSDGDLEGDSGSGSEGGSGDDWGGDYDDYDDDYGED